MSNGLGDTTYGYDAIRKLRSIRSIHSIATILVNSHILYVKTKIEIFFINKGGRIKLERGGYARAVILPSEDFVIVS